MKKKISLKLLSQVTTWVRVLNAARATVGKTNINKEPSNKWKKRMLLAEHSPIRLLEYDIEWENIKMWVTTHLVRHHIGCEKFVRTQREDRNNEVIVRDEMLQGAMNDMMMTCNAQSFINISRKRLCAQASSETREAWWIVIEAMYELDPILADCCVPECIYRGFCPEEECCHYVNTKAYQKRLIEYRDVNYVKK